jgi:hypothetical protein
VPLAHLLVTNWGIRSSASGRWGACGLLFARIAHPGFGWTSLTCDRERLRFKLFLDYRIFGFFNSSNNVTLPTACGVGAPPPVLTCAATTERVVLSISDRQVDQAIIFGGRFSFGP